MVSSPANKEKKERPPLQIKKKKKEHAAALLIISEGVIASHSPKSKGKFTNLNANTRLVAS